MMNAASNVHDDVIPPGTDMVVAGLKASGTTPGKAVGGGFWAPIFEITRARKFNSPMSKAATARTRYLAEIVAWRPLTSQSLTPAAKSSVTRSGYRVTIVSWPSVT